MAHELAAAEHPLVVVDPFARYFFKRLAEQQTPTCLWVGCSDSRVPASQVTGLKPGEIFEHRNIANVVVPTDLNLLSVVQYAVDVLKVGHIIVCGHYGCGGVQAALQGSRHGLVDNWLCHLKDLARHREDELEGLSPEDRISRFCEINVRAQARNLARTTIVQDAWDRGQAIDIHSWIYCLDDGHLKNLASPIRADRQPDS